MTRREGGSWGEREGAGEGGRRLEREVGGWGGREAAREGGRDAGVQQKFNDQREV